MDKELVAVVLWNIWNARNGIIFEGSNKDPLSLAFTFWRISGLHHVSHPLSQVGVVVRDWNGKFIAGLSKKITGILATEVVEAYARKATVILLQQMNLQNVEIEDDSQKVFVEQDQLDHYQQLVEFQGLVVQHVLDLGECDE
ncbi:hypothetical protein ACH5RR_023160 [Cinchona calisaya]|uniref:RNase H type-1 domain-containing protein n=1 Tax=Cinchona calisaya TaxID=153742 RepID=A0ABD2ZEV4_9GENT